MAATTDVIIKVENIVKEYGPHRVLKGVSLSCSKGEICAVLGANGAGKSTLFKIITGLIAPSSGKVAVFSDSKKTISGIIEKPSLYPYLTAKENLQVFSKMQALKLSVDDINQKLMEVGLLSNNPLRVNKYSMGMKQRLGIAIALLNDPKSLIWDEPFSGLDPMGTDALKDLILQLAKKKDLAILISSHIMGPLLSLCDTLYVLKEGELLVSGALESILDKYISRYEIRGEGIDKTTLFKKYKILMEGNRAIVDIGASDLNQLLQELIDEGVSIRSCHPIIKFEELL